MRVLRMERIVNTTCKLDVLQLKCRSCFIHYYDQQAREFLKLILRPDSCLHWLYFLLRAIKLAKLLVPRKFPALAYSTKNIPITHKFRSPALSDIGNLLMNWGSQKSVNSSPISLRICDNAVNDWYVCFSLFVSLCNCSMFFRCLYGE